MRASKWMVILAMTATAGSAFGVEEGAYAVTGVGSAKARGAGLSKNSDIALKLLFGYQFNKNMGVEGEIFNLGKVEAAAASYNTVGWGVAAVGLLPIRDNLVLFGKLGAVQTSTDTNPLPGSTTIAAREYKTSLTFGLGGQYYLSKNLGVRLSWDRYKTPVVAVGEINAYSVAAVFRF